MLGLYKKSWADAFLKGADMSTHIDASECANCKQIRTLRKRVLSHDAEDVSASGQEIVPAEVRQPPFTDAPALYSFNVPRYFNIQLRAREFARQWNSQLLWCHAVDVPLHPGDRDLPDDAMQRKLASWLCRHDQDTSHLSSLLPLIKNLPVRITDSIDRDLQLYKGRRGKIYGWTLHPETLFTDLENGESLLDRLPLVIYIHFPEATWTIGKLPQGVYPLRSKSRTWKVNKYTHIKARRTGYLLIPDFGSTAHMIQGATLDAAFWGCQDAAGKVSMACQISGYVILSRVKELWSIFILQAFSPCLFIRGPPKGPDRLIRKLRGDITAEQAMEEWLQEEESDEGEANENSTDPMKKQYRCTSCYLQGKKSMHPLARFGVNDHRQFNHRFLRQGCWTRCTSCSQKQGVASRWNENGDITESATQGKTSAADNVCTICAERWPGKEVHVDCHICCGCQQECPRAHWTAKIMEWHRKEKTRKLVCQVCTGKGRSSTDVELYHCDGCGQDLGHLRFNKYSKYNKAQSGRSRADLLCLDCESKIPCDVCKTRYPKTSWPVQTLKNQKKQGIKIVCRSCKEKGCTANDTDLYTCQQCHNDFGSKRFNTDLLKDFKYQDRRKLMCLVCVREVIEKEKRLHREFKKSKVYCKCGCRT